MNDIASSLSSIRDQMKRFPPLESHSPGVEISPSEIYFPKSHASALDPDRSLIIGNRGMGKSFWASALVDINARKSIAESLPEARLAQGAVDVKFGFAGAEGVEGVSRDELALFLKKQYPVEQIWRAVTLLDVAKYAKIKVPIKLGARLDWIANDPSSVREVLRAADVNLSKSGGKIVFVFDQLEQLADDLSIRAELTKGILKLALAFKSYRSLRVKIFMRPDHYAEDQLFAFPDASKVKGEAITLDWRPVDLYGLIFSRFFKEDRKSFAAVLGLCEVDIRAHSTMPRELTFSEELQHKVFDIIAGDAMGVRKRGLPYTWLVSHLADARNQVSPRTFLRALKYAAENEPAPTVTAIDYFGIHEGVRKASENRVDDLKEDYPWVTPALQALSGLLVPCTPEEMIAKWQNSDDLVGSLIKNIPSIKRPVWLEKKLKDEIAQLESLLFAMADVGVIEIRRTTGKVDVPDIFRLPAGIKRKGGITQQQRRKARVTVA